MSYFKHMEEENKKCRLGGMAWDDISWYIRDAIEDGCTKTKLALMFPSLLGHLLVNDENYQKEKERLLNFKENYLKTAELLKTNKQTWTLVTDNPEDRLNLANRYYEYGKNCDLLLESLESEYLEWKQETSNNM